MKKRKQFFWGLAVAVLLMGTLYGCKKDNDKDTGSAVTNTPTVSVTPEATKGPDNGDITVTPETTATPVPTEQGQDKEEVLTEEEAFKRIRDNIPDTSYSIQLSDDHLIVDGKEYYIYIVMKDKKAVEPAILVDKLTGDLFYYDQDGNVTDFTKFPLDNTENIATGDGSITKEEALDKLAGYKKESLGLKRSFSEYETETDTWTTVVEGKECYGINVFDGKASGRPLTGVYYVALDGSSVFTVDEDNNFVKVK